MKKKLADLEEIKRQNDQYKRDILDSNTKRNELQQKFERVLEDHKQEMQREYDERQKLISEKDELKQNLKQAEKKIAD